MTETLFHPIHILMIISIILAMIAFQKKERRDMFMWKFASDLTLCIYMFLMNGTAATLSIIVALVGVMIQIVTPVEKLKETLLLRAGLATVLAGVAFVFSFQRLSDIWPVLAVVYPRFVEIISNRNIIALCFALNVVPWICYNINNQFYYPLVMNVLVLASLFIGYIRHRKTI
jgi:Bacterial inner membrane protein